MDVNKNDENSKKTEGGHPLILQDEVECTDGRNVYLIANSFEEFLDCLETYEID